jgi:DNA adenine methylase
MSKTSRHPLLFRYPGGKHYAINLLNPFIDCVEHTEYREPFVGGGSVFFNKEKSAKNWINDIDKELAITYKLVADPVTRKKLIKLVGNEIATKERWRELFEFQPKTELEVAYKYYYLNRTSFSGKLISAAWGYRPKRSLPPERWFERINPCGEKLEGVKITSVDFEKVIRATSKNEVLIFADPPYFSPTKNKHYRHGFTAEDHLRLSGALKETDFKFILTYDDCSGVRDLYKWANVYPVEFFYRVENSNTFHGQRKSGFELIITNFDFEKLRSK